MGLVSQDNFLFNQSIRENIRLGRPEATDAEIVEAARAAGVHEVIVELPEGYDTPVGERGGRLSGGQRQRIALARALVRQPAILLLDEATSALDPESEAAISETLQDLAGRCTILSVTHRLAPVASMDHIIVMDHGQVIEQGNHTELMAQEGLYYRLFTQQSGFSVSGDGLHGKITTARLRSIPLFADVDEAGLARLASQFIAEPYPAGRPVFRQADAGDKFYIVARGRVAVTVAGNQGPETRLDVLQDGDYFGEIALLEDVPRTATVETLLPSLFLTLNRQHFLAMLSEFPGIRAAVERAAAARRLDLSAAMQP
jgi:ATP-binding cassette subfamily B protein